MFAGLHDEIDLQKTLNANSPFAVGLLFFGLALPKRMAGPTLYDISPKKHRCMFGGMTTGYGFQSTSRDGGYGRIGFNGSSSYGSLAIDLSAYAKIVLAFWANYATVASPILFEYTANYNNFAGGFVGGQDGGLFQVGMSDGGGQYETSEFTTPSTGEWHHWIICFDRTAPSPQITPIYIDGLPQSLSHAFSAAQSGNFANSTLYLASRAGTGRFALCSLDAIQIFASAPFMAKQAKALYDESRSGFPTLLNRKKRSSIATILSPRSSSVATTFLLSGVNS